MDQAEKDRILEAASKEAQRWLDAFSLDGNYNKEAVLEELKKRQYKKEGVVVRVVDSPKEATEAILDGAREVMGVEELDKETLDKLKEAYSCIWDYYDMAFYESAYSQLPDKSKLSEEDQEFFEQTLFSAFESGLGFLINLGSLLVGVMRPEAYRDEDLRIHREDGPAIIWGKEEPQYWWHGVQIEKDWIENKEGIDPKQAFTHPNVEQRRALCEIVGWEKIVEACGARVIQKDDYGELLELDSDDGKVRFVRVTCPTTGRIYVLCVPEDVKTCHEGVARGFNMTPEEYNPTVQT
jgi:hypothetical protein